MFDPGYEAQVRLLLRCIPEISRHPCFALKGDTAINLFVKDLPRISVDINLTYMPLEPRREALQEIHDTLISIKDEIQQRVRNMFIRFGNEPDRNVNSGYFFWPIFEKVTKVKTPEYSHSLPL